MSTLPLDVEVSMSIVRTAQPGSRIFPLAQFVALLNCLASHASPSSSRAPCVSTQAARALAFQPSPYAPHLPPTLCYGKLALSVPHSCGSSDRTYTSPSIGRMSFLPFTSYVTAIAAVAQAQNLCLSINPAPLNGMSPVQDSCRVLQVLNQP